MVVFFVVGGYIAASVLFLKFPSLLHKKKIQKFKAVHISHRGGAAENLENTMTAFNYACSSHTDMLELDCQITQDGVVVISHDNDLSRITGHHVLISETPFKDLPHLKNQLKTDFYWGRGGLVSGLDRRIPPLEDLMIAHPRVPLNIDIKVDNDQLICKVADLVRKYQREDITVWGSRSTLVTEKLLKEHPDIGVFFPARRVLSVVALFYLGLLPFVPIRETHFEMLMPNIALKEGIFAIKLDWKWRFLIRVIDFFLMNRHLFQHLQDRGIEVYLWVLNEEDDWRRAFSYGATGVMTDFPTKLRQFLEDNPQCVRQRSN